MIFVLFSQTAWVFIQSNAEWKPLQFLAFAFVYRIFEKLKAFEPAVTPTFTVSIVVFLNFYLKTVSSARELQIQ